jgi:hypothetical protein
MKDSATASAEAPWWEIPPPRRVEVVPVGRGRLFGAWLDVGAGDLAGLPEPESLVGPYLPRGGLTLVYGRGGSLKSFVCQGAAWCLAAGRPWGPFPVKPVPVVYWAGEGRAGLEQRFAALGIHHQASLPAGRLFVPSRWPKLDDPRIGPAIAAEVAEVGAGFVVIDTANRVKGRLREDSADDMGSGLFGALEYLLDGGVAVALVHHSGWADAHSRGSSALFDNADSVLRVTRDGRRVTLAAEKDRHGEPAPLLYLEAHEVGGSLVVLPTAGRPMGDHARRILAALEAAGAWLTLTQLEALTGIDKRRASEALSTLVGVSVERDGAGRTGRAVRFRAVPETFRDSGRKVSRPEVPE